MSYNIESTKSFDKEFQFLAKDVFLLLSISKKMFQKQKNPLQTKVF